MKTIGLIGGMSWESSAEYYRIINETVNKTLGGVHSAQCLMYSFDFDEIEALQNSGDWDKLTDMMISAAHNLKKGGADFIVICTNTMHLMADAVKKATGMPLLHIADAAADKIKSENLKKVGLLGTRFTMEKDFYKKRLKEIFNIDVIIPGKNDRQVVHDIIYKELVTGIIKNESREKYIKIINKLTGEGAEGIVLGCTEIPLLVKQEDISVPVFDTTEIHANAAVEFALI